MNGWPLCDPCRYGRHRECQWEMGCECSSDVCLPKKGENDGDDPETLLRDKSLTRKVL